MKSYPIIASSFVLITFFLLGAVLSVPHPIDKDFNHCIKKLIQQTGITDKEQLLLSFPKLHIAEHNCKKVKDLKLKIEMIKGGAAPQVSQMDYEKIKKHQEHIKRLEIQNQHILSQVLANSKYKGL